MGGCSSSTLTGRDAAGSSGPVVEAASSGASNLRTPKIRPNALGSVGGGGALGRPDKDPTVECAVWDTDDICLETAVPGRCTCAAVEGSELYQPAVHADADGWARLEAKIVRLKCRE